MNIQKAGFSPQKRLRVPADYKRVFERPLRSISSYFKVLARVNEKPVARLGVIVSKKAVRRAVSRNRVKRLIRESFRINQQTLVGLDVVVLLKQDVMTKQHKTSPQNALIRHWAELKALWKKV